MINDNVKNKRLLREKKEHAFLYKREKEGLLKILHKTFYLNMYVWIKLRTC